MWLVYVHLLLLLQVPPDPDATPKAMTESPPKMEIDVDATPRGLLLVTYYAFVHNVNKQTFQIILVGGTGSVRRNTKSSFRTPRRTPKRVGLCLVFVSF